MQCSVVLLINKMHRLAYLHLCLVQYVITFLETEFWGGKMKKDDMAFFQCSQEIEEISYRHSSYLNSQSTVSSQTFSNTNPLSNNCTKLLRL